MPGCSVDNIRLVAANFLAVEEGDINSMTKNTLSGPVREQTYTTIYASFPTDELFISSQLMYMLSN